MFVFLCDFESGAIVLQGFEQPGVFPPSPNVFTVYSCLVSTVVAPCVDRSYTSFD